jgi:hypothetical protein
VWKVTTVPSPSTFFANEGRHLTECAAHKVDQCDTYAILLENVGGATSEGNVTVSLKLPPGVTLAPEGIVGESFESLSPCSEPSQGEAVCTFEQSVPRAGFLLMRAYVKVEPSVASPMHATVTLSGGGAESPAPLDVATPIGTHGKALGIEEFGAEALGLTGKPSTQAGAHPSLFTTTLSLTTNETEGGPARPAEHVKDLTFYLPLGFVGDAQATPRCPVSLVEGGFNVSGCPSTTQIGDVVPNGLPSLALEVGQPSRTNAFGIYNVQPEAGMPAEFAFPVSGQQLFTYTAVVRRHGAYVLRVDVPGVPVIAGLFFVTTSFFGDITQNVVAHEEESKTIDNGAFLTNPSNCTAGAADTEVELNTWEQPARTVNQTSATYPHVDGCRLLSFGPTLSLTPDETRADQPSGYTLGINVPQAPNFGPDLATPPVKNVSLTFPEGVSISPGAADGLGVCQATGPEGINIPGDTSMQLQNPEAEELGPDGLPHLAPGKCPGASQVASVTAATPILPETLPGHIYVAAPLCGGAAQHPCEAADAENGSLFRAYLEIANPTLGIYIKLAGTLHVNATTGQITAVFEDNPQFPLSKLEIHTLGGPRAVLATPQACGQATASSTISAWSGEGTRPDRVHVEGTPDAHPGASFPITGCTNTFAPAFSGESVETHAGGYTPFTLTLNRADGEQNISRLNVTLPSGLTAVLAHVGQCPEPQASLGSCSSAEQIGTVTVAVGSGSHPYYVKGAVYLTGPYNGGPFGLSIVVPAVAGPFNLGDVVVRAALRINPLTAQVTAESDPIPQIRDGVPLRLKVLNVTIDRREFVVNPTACSQMAVTGTVYSTQGAQRALSTPFAAAGCGALPFAPTLTASTSGTPSKLNGESLRVRIAQKPGEANIRKVKLAIPKVLPSKLTTLQKACPEAQFAANPAACPAASVVGMGAARTPLLRSALTGPAYLVSHGGAGFPDVVFLLQGEGVQIQLVGNTDIKHGITYSRFEAVPDAPVSSFEAVFPQGPHSLLTEYGKLCATTTRVVAKRFTRRVHGRTVHGVVHIRERAAAPLPLPETVVGQNGRVVQRTAAITVAGCPATRPHSASATKRARRNAGRGRVLAAGRP